MTIHSDLNDINERLKKINTHLENVQKALEIANMSIGQAIDIAKPKLELVKSAKDSDL